MPAAALMAFPPHQIKNEAPDYRGAKKIPAAAMGSTGALLKRRSRNAGGSLLKTSGDHHRDDSAMNRNNEEACLPRRSCIATSLPGWKAASPAATRHARMRPFAQACEHGLQNLPAEMLEAAAAPDVHDIPRGATKAQPRDFRYPPKK